MFRDPITGTFTKEDAMEYQPAPTRSTVGGSPPAPWQRRAPTPQPPQGGAWSASPQAPRWSLPVNGPPRSLSPCGLHLDSSGRPIPAVITRSATPDMRAQRPAQVVVSSPVVNRARSPTINNGNNSSHNNVNTNNAVQTVVATASSSQQQQQQHQQQQQKLTHSNNNNNKTQVPLPLQLGNPTIRAASPLVMGSQRTEGRSQGPIFRTGRTPSPVPVGMTLHPVANSSDNSNNNNNSNNHNGSISSNYYHRSPNYYSNTTTSKPVVQAPSHYNYYSNNNSNTSNANNNTNSSNSNNYYYLSSVNNSTSHPVPIVRPAGMATGPSSSPGASVLSSSPSTQVPYPGPQRSQRQASPLAQTPQQQQHHLQQQKLQQQKLQQYPQQVRRLYSSPSPGPGVVTASTLGLDWNRPPASLPSSTPPVAHERVGQHPARWHSVPPGAEGHPRSVSPTGPHLAQGAAAIGAAKRMQSNPSRTLTPQPPSRTGMVMVQTCGPNGCAASPILGQRSPIVVRRCTSPQGPGRTQVQVRTLSSAPNETQASSTRIAVAGVNTQSSQSRGRSQEVRGAYQVQVAPAETLRMRSIPNNFQRLPSAQQPIPQQQQQQQQQQPTRSQPQQQQQQQPQQFVQQVQPPQPVQQVQLQQVTLDKSPPSRSVTVYNGSPPTASPPSPLPPPVPPASPVEYQIEESSEQDLVEGMVVTIGQARCRIDQPLGFGSFGAVWAAEDVDSGEALAIKEILCCSQADYLNALFEGHLLNGLGGSVPSRAPSDSNRTNNSNSNNNSSSNNKSSNNNKSSSNNNNNKQHLLLPALAGSETQNLGENRWRVRLAMSKLDGEPLDAYLQRCQDRCLPPISNWSSLKAHFLAGGLFAGTLLGQLCPAFEKISAVAFHRDVNAHNILVDGAQSMTTTPLNHTPLRFGLVDFGLAVEASCWQKEDDLPTPDSRPSRVGQDGAYTWHHLDVGGDCRYWPVSAWVQFLLGWTELEDHPPWRFEYRTQLDLHSLGLTVLQALAETLPPAPLDRESLLEVKNRSSGDAMVDNLFREVVSLRVSWDRYWDTVLPWHTRLMDTFHGAGDWDVLKTSCLEADLQSSVGRRLNDLREILRRIVSASQKLAERDHSLKDIPPIFSALLLLVSAGQEMDPASEGPAKWREVMLTLMGQGAGELPSSAYTQQTKGPSDGSTAHACRNNGRPGNSNSDCSGGNSNNSNSSNSHSGNHAGQNGSHRGRVGNSGAVIDAVAAWNLSNAGSAASTASTPTLGVEGLTTMKMGGPLGNLLNPTRST